MTEWPKSSNHLTSPHNQCKTIKCVFWCSYNKKLPTSRPKSPQTTLCSSIIIHTQNGNFFATQNQDMVMNLKCQHTLKEISINTVHIFLEHLHTFFLSLFQKGNGGNFQEPSNPFSVSSLKFSNSLSLLPT